MAFPFPNLIDRDHPSRRMTPQHPQPRHQHPFPTASPGGHHAAPVPHWPPPPPFRRRGSTMSSVASTSSSVSFPHYTTTTTTTPTTASHPAPPLSPDDGGTPAAVLWINGFPGVGKLAIAQFLHRLLGIDRSLIFDQQSQLAHENGGGAMMPPTPQVEIADPFFALPGTPTPPPPRAGEGREGRGVATGSLPDLLSRPENAGRTIIVTSCVLIPETSRPKDGAAAREGTREGGDMGGVVVGREGDEIDAIAAAKECREISAEYGRPFLPVYLTCQEEENMRRVQSLERRYSSSSSTALPTRPPLPSRSQTRPSPSFPYQPPTYFRAPSSRDRINRAGVARSLRVGRELFVFEGVKGLDLNVTELEAHEAAMDILSFLNAGVDEYAAAREAAGET